MLPANTAAPIRVGVIGTGFIARDLFLVTRPMKDLEVTRMLTRRPLDACSNLPDDAPLTQSVSDLLDHCDVVVECSGDVIHATDVIAKAFEADLPVVTMNSEFHITCGSFFVNKGYLTEAEGDQPGCTAALRRDVRHMGFEPLVYGTMKGFLNPNPTYDEMLYWSEKQGIRINKTVSFTDGTKVQIEQAFVANAFGAGIARPGMMAPRSDDFESAAKDLATVADGLGFPIIDLIISQQQPPGVFIVAKHDAVHHTTLEYLKLGKGPYYSLIRPYHLCAFEIPKTIRRVMAGYAPLLNNTTCPTIGVAAVAKVPLEPGDKIDFGVGSFKVRGKAVSIASEPRHVPIGILYDATVTRAVEPGAMLTIDDVDLPDSHARDIALAIVRSNQQTSRRSGPFLAAS